jgi:hypothetical protein
MKSRLVFSCQMHAERKRMAGVTASPEGVYPMITDPDAGWGQGLVTAKRL